MSVYDRAHELARALKQSEVYREYLAAKGKMEQNEAALSMFRDFRRKQFELQKAQILGQKLSEEQIQQIESLSGLITQHSMLKEFLEMEYRLGQMIADVQKILAEGIDFDFNPFLDDGDQE